MIKSNHMFCKKWDPRCCFDIHVLTFKGALNTAWELFNWAVKDGYEYYT